MLDLVGLLAGTIYHKENITAMIVSIISIAGGLTHLHLNVRLLTLFHALALNKYSVTQLFREKDQSRGRTHRHKRFDAIFSKFGRLAFLLKIPTPVTTLTSLWHSLSTVAP